MRHAVQMGLTWEVLLREQEWGRGNVREEKKEAERQRERYTERDRERERGRVRREREVGGVFVRSHDTGRCGETHSVRSSRGGARRSWTLTLLPSLLKKGRS